MSLAALGALVALGVATLNLPWTRSWLARELARLVSSQITGTLSVARIGHIGLGSVAGVDAEVTDASGHAVLAVSELSAELDIVRAAVGLFSDGPLPIRLERTSASHVLVDLHADSAAGAALLEALAPSDDGAENGDAEAASSRPLQLELADVAVRAVSVRGGGGPLGTTDVDLHALEARARVDQGSVLVELKRARVEARGVPAVGSLTGELWARVDVPDSGDPMQAAVEARWSGATAGMPIESLVLFDGRQLSGYVRGTASARALGQLWPAASSSANELNALIAFEGPLHDLALRAVAESRSGNLYIESRVNLVEASGRATLIGTHLNASRWLSGAPPTALQFVAALELRSERDTLTGRLVLRTSPGLVAGHALPELVIRASLSPTSIGARLQLDSPAMRALLQVDLLRAAVTPAPRTTFALHADVEDVGQALASLGGPATFAGQASIEARGALELGAHPSWHDADLHASLRDVRMASMRAPRAALAISAHGPLARPRLALELDATGVTVPHFALDRLQVSGHGSIEELLVQARLEPRRAAPVRVAGRVSVADASFSDIALSAGSGAEAVRASARSFRVTADGYELRQLELSGPGRLELDAELGATQLRVRGRTQGFSAAALARRLGLDLQLPHGEADLAMDMAQRGGVWSGTLAGTVERFQFGGLPEASIQADLRVQRGMLHGQGRVNAGPVGQLLVRADALALPIPWRPSSLEHLNGSLELAAMADLDELSSLDGFEDLTGASLGGTIEAKFLVRGSARQEPSARLAIVTRDLTWSRSRSGAVPAMFDAIPSPGIDLDLGVDLQGPLLRASAALRSGEHSPIAELSGTARLPVQRLLRDPASFDPRELDVDVRLHVPEREFDELPAALRWAALDGSVSAEATLRGKLGRPELAAQLEVLDLRLENSRRSLPLAIVAEARLADDRLSASAAIRDEQRKLVSLHADALVGGAAEPGVRQLEAELRSNGLPLAALGALLGQDLAGELYGSLELEAGAGAPKVEGTLWVNGPTFRGFRQEQARWSIEAGPRSFSTKLALEQRGGSAHVRLRGPWSWTGARLPDVDRQLVQAEVHAQRFDLRALEPLMPPATRGISGRLDAEFAIAPDRRPLATGGLSLRDGHIYLAALGQEFHGIALDATLDASGDISVEQLEARALRGRLDATGQIQMQGLAFRGAHLELSIPRGDPLPFTLEGVTVAHAWGELDIAAKGERGSRGDLRALSIEVDVPRLQIVLPARAPADVQELTEDPTILTGTYLRAGRFVSLPLPPYEGAETPAPAEDELVVRAHIVLGDAVWVEQEPLLELKVLGDVQVEADDEVTVRGQLRLARGNIEVQGRVFQIERGEITFVEEREPANPTVIATGVYTAPEGTRVYAEFVGPVDTGNLTLRSEPPLRDDQILSLLLFGSPDGSFGSTTEESSVGATALVAGGSLVARGLNLELRRLTSLDIQTRIGEREGEPQPEVVVQVTPRVTAELAYRLEEANPGRTQDRTYLTLDLRLFRNWSLSTTIGDAGSFVLELLWRYRF